MNPCDHCKLKVELPPQVWGPLSESDRRLQQRYQGYLQVLTSRFCPMMSSSNAQRLCWSALVNAARRMPQGVEHPLGLWRWLLADEAAKAQDQVQAERPLRYDDERGESLHSALDSILSPIS